MWSARRTRSSRDAGDLSQDADRQPGTWKRLPPHELVVQAELLADRANFVLEEQPQRLDQLEAHQLGQAPDVVMALDHVRRSNHRHAFDHVRIERPLSEEIERAQPGRLRFEDVDERAPDDLALLLRIGHATEPLEEQLRGVDEVQRQFQALEPAADLRRFVQPHHAVVDEDARQAIPDRAMDQHRRNGGIDAAAQATDHASLPRPARGSVPSPLSRTRPSSSRRCSRRFRRRSCGGCRPRDQYVQPPGGRGARTFCDPGPPSPRPARSRWSP